MSLTERVGEQAACARQGLLPLLAPLTPHLAEDAWQNLPWAPPTRSVFQAGWFCAPDAWRSLPQDTLGVFSALLALRCGPERLCLSPRPGLARRVLGAARLMSSWHSCLLPCACPDTPSMRQATLFKQLACHAPWRSAVSYRCLEAAPNTGLMQRAWVAGAR